MNKNVQRTKRMEPKEEDQRKTKRKIKKPKKPNGFKENPTKPKKPDNDKEEDKDKEDDEDNVSSISDEDVAKIDKLMIECLNTTNTNNIMECIGYLGKIPIELIEYGLRKTARKQFPSWQYAMTILDDYVRKKFKTIEEVKADELNFKSQSANKNGIPEETEEEKMARKIRELEESQRNGSS